MLVMALRCSAEPKDCFRPQTDIQVCAHLNMAVPSVVDIVDGYACDLAFEGRRITVMQDNWTCSVASESEHIRDRIYAVLQSVDI